MNDTELAIALSFAKLEIIELQAGTRSLTQCPGLKSLAEAIAKAEAVTKNSARRSIHTTGEKT